MECIDRDYVDRVINDIREALSLINKIIGIDIDKFISDLGLRYELRHSIIVIVEAIASLGIHILEKCYGLTPKSYGEVLEGLWRKNVISFETYDKIYGLIPLRHRIIHRYWEVDDKRIYLDAKASGVGAIERFIEEVERFASKDP